MVFGSGVNLHSEVGRRICLPGEIVLSLTPDASVVVGNGLVVVPMPHQSVLSRLGLGEVSLEDQGDEEDEENGAAENIVSGKRNRTDDDDHDQSAGHSYGITSYTFIAAAVMGPLRTDTTASGATRYFIPSAPTAKRYIPKKGDAVVGVIMKQQNQVYLVNIGAPHPALLGVTAFDGATKSNRPKLRAGDSVYCHIAACEVDLDVELTCCAPAGMPVRDWVTGEALFGKLKGGTIVHLPLQLCKDLYSNKSAALAYLGEKVPFEICIGLNARAWINPYVADPVEASGTINGSAAAADGTSKSSTALKIEMSNTIAIKRCLEELAAADDAANQRVKSLIDDLFGEAVVAATTQDAMVNNNEEDPNIDDFQDGDWEKPAAAGGNAEEADAAPAAPQ